ncbi:Double-stranded RNA-binding domain [Sesbania bispinosa]|nr:Double-stranded RNA-binding domain [Sesbania bispinosa]
MTKHGWGCLQRDDETRIYKNLLQETAHKAGLNIPVYKTIRSGPGHVPNFSCTVEIAGMHFAGNRARTKKQAQKKCCNGYLVCIEKM